MHDTACTPSDLLDAPTRDFYRESLRLLDESDTPYCVAGAYAMAAHAGIIRHTKDLDIFLRRSDLQKATEIFADAGYRIEHTHPHWLAKAFAQPPTDAFIDFIFRAASGIWEVDDEWLARVTPGPVVGRTAPLCAPEELIWSKAMVMERNRFDGADIAHVLHFKASEIDWDRLLRRAAGHEGVLLGHLAFFRYVYPDDAHNIPAELMQELLRRVIEQPIPGRPVCRGTMLSWDQYLTDVNGGGLVDGRLKPWGTLHPEEIARWTAAEK